MSYLLAAHALSGANSLAQEKHFHSNACVCVCLSTKGLARGEGEVNGSCLNLSILFCHIVFLCHVCRRLRLHCSLALCSDLKVPLSLANLLYLRWHSLTFAFPPCSLSAMLLLLLWHFQMPSLSALRSRFACSFSLLPYVSIIGICWMNGLYVPQGIRISLPMRCMKQPLPLPLPLLLLLQLRLSLVVCVTVLGASISLSLSRCVPLPVSLVPSACAYILRLKSKRFYIVIVMTARRRTLARL